MTDTLAPFMRSLGHDADTATPPAAPTAMMAPGTSPFWDAVATAARDSERRIGVACAGTAVAMVVMIAGRVLVAWAGGAL